MEDGLLGLFFRATEDYAIILLDREGAVRGWNPGAELLFGWSESEVMGASGHLIFVGSDRRAGVPELEMKTASEFGRAEDERWHHRKDGSRFWASGVLVALRNNGSIHGYAKVVRDFTERRRLDEAVRETQKLESVGVLAAGVAHDFNNVLTAIIGNLSLARNRPPDTPVGHLHDLLDSADRAAQRAAELVRQLLDYAGKGRREVRPVDVARIVTDTISIVRASVSPKIHIELDAPSSLSVNADAGQLHQLVLNLILNGAEAIGDASGSVEVRLRVRPLSEAELRDRYAGFPLPPRPYTELVIRDTGQGMSDEVLRKIFDPFFTTKFLGRGLGLAAALGIVRSHGGGIAVESAPGQGTVFRVLLPAEQADPEPPKTVAEAVAEAGRGEGLVLVVDDEAAVRALVQRMLEDLGYTVLVAENGDQAVELVKRTGQEIVLVLLDLAMPVMDGVATATEVQARRPDLPIVIMSGLGGDDDAVGRLESLRIAGFVPKPFAPEHLGQVVAVALRRLSR